jgi:hypothetical protein
VLLITGMHRSGTSMTAQMLQAAGLFIGERLMGSHPSNPKGHFEDLDFYDLTRAIIADNGFPDSGFACDVRISVSADRRRQADELVASRRALGCPWGWKDPRSVLLLDFWKELLPEAHVLFTFRAPWEVMDSLYRRGDAACQHGQQRPPLDRSSDTSRSAVRRHSIGRRACNIILTTSCIL